MWARNGRWILPEMPDFHVAFRHLLHAVNLRHRTNGFTSPPKEGVLRIFSPWKIRRLRPGLNPQTWIPKASTLPLDHRIRYIVVLVERLWGKSLAFCSGGKRFDFRQRNCLPYMTIYLLSSVSTGNCRGDLHKETMKVCFQIVPAHPSAHWADNTVWMKSAYWNNRQFLRKRTFKLFPSLSEMEAGRHSKCIYGHWSVADSTYTPDRNFTLQFPIVIIYKRIMNVNKMTWNSISHVRNGLRA